MPPLAPHVSPARHETSMLIALRELQDLEAERIAAQAQEEAERRREAARQQAQREAEAQAARAAAEAQAARDALLLAEEARLRVAVEAREAVARAVVAEAEERSAALRAARDGLAEQLAQVQRARPAGGRRGLVLGGLGGLFLCGLLVGWQAAAARPPRVVVAPAPQVPAPAPLACPPPMVAAAPAVAAPVQAPEVAPRPRPARPHGVRPARPSTTPDTDTLLRRCGDDPLCGVVK